jgi:regulator of protease activity HflC (stomatin/prohibitin superfamily)
MKKLLEKNIWTITIITFAIISIVVTLIVSVWLNLLISAVIGVLLFLTLLGILLIQAIVSVPERYNYILTYFGRYHNSLKPGLNFVYPWFNIFNIPIAYNIAEHSINVFEDANNDYAEMVEFKESAAWIKLSARVKVINPEKAYTEVEDVYKEIKEIFKKYFRDYAEDKDLLDFKDKNENIDLDTLVGSSNILNYFENNWGMKIISIRLEDIILSEADRQVREEVYAERNRLDVVKIQNKQTIAKAKAEAKKITEIAKAEQTAQEFEGLGLKVALERITESNLSPEEASRFLQAIKKWEAVPQVQTGFFSDGNQSSAESGISKQAMAEIIAMANEIGKKQ